mgnify:FL=1
MKVATSPEYVGVKELKNHLSRYIERVREGSEVIVTDYGKPVARLSPLDGSTDRLAEMVAAGLVSPPRATTRHRLSRRITGAGSVSDLVAEQRQ